MKATGSSFRARPTVVCGFTFRHACTYSGTKKGLKTTSMLPRNSTT